jgi:hypothetical protein
MGGGPPTYEKRDLSRIKARRGEHCISWSALAFQDLNPVLEKAREWQ